MDFTSLKIVIVMWQFGFVDTFTLVTFMSNAGPQYSALIVASMADGNSTKLPILLFEPLSGLGVGYQFVRAAKNASDRRERLITLVALL